MQVGVPIGNRGSRFSQNNWAIDAASRLYKIDNVTGQIQQLVESKESASMQYVRQALHGRM